MNTTIWVIQGLLALVFAVSGLLKARWSVERLVKSGQTGVEGLPVSLVRFIALSELAGAAGVLRPRATGIFPMLTPLAASGLGVIMVLAAIVHARRGEAKTVLVNTEPSVLPHSLRGPFRRTQRVQRQRAFKTSASLASCVQMTRA
jgi:hypothetical protein